MNKTHALDIGTILATKDGRKIGNAIVTGREGCTWKVKTNYGNELSFTSQEIEDLFYIAYEEFDEDKESSITCDEVQKMQTETHKHSPFFLCENNKECELTLREFLSKYSHNNLIRLWFKEKGKSSHVIVGSDSKDVSMDHQIIKGKGIFGMYADFKVVELSSILCQGPYPEAINVVILKEGKKEHHGISIEDDIRVAKKHLGTYFKGVESTDLCILNNNCNKEQC